MESALKVLLVVCACGTFARAEELNARVRAELATALERHPGLQYRVEGQRVASLYGTSMAAGDSALQSADAFRLSEASVFGAEPNELVLGSYSESRQTQPLMYDPASGTSKFILVYYHQARDGVPVFRGELRVLVRNETEFPVAWARSTARDLGDFSPALPGGVQEDAAHAAAQQLYPELSRFNGHRTVIWAGHNDVSVAPVTAVSFVAEAGDGQGAHQKRLFVANATTGEILYEEDMIHFTDVQGNVSGRVTADHKAWECSPEVLTPYPHATVYIQGGATATSNADGNFVIPHGGTTSVTVESPVQGVYFDVLDVTGNDEVLTTSVLPPGPANFVHNNANNDELIIAQANGYVHSHQVRDFALQYNPSYPTISTETDFVVRVNRTDLFCPGNAWYDGTSLNFCQSDPSLSPNTAFGGVIHHEYGHHMIAKAGSGQGAYGEGMSDAIAVLMADDPGIGYGFYWQQCTVTLRNAENNCQYAPVGCSSCGASKHICGQVLSGAVWDTRQELALTEGAAALDILSNLTVNSIFLHTGDQITPQLAIDFLTLDDDDANLSNATPHWAEICAGFGAHSLDCPRLQGISFEFPNGIPDMLSPGLAKVVAVNVVNAGVDPIPGSGTVRYRVGSVGSFTSVAMNEISPNQYEATLPGISCGSNLQFYFSAEAEEFGLRADPFDSPELTHMAISGMQVVPVQAFDFETDTGWTVIGDADAGHWERGIPLGDGTRGDPVTDYDGSGQCYLTENAAGDSDVDGGTTYLYSPVLDLSDLQHPYVSYARWFSNSTGDNPFDDEFRVQVSSNGTTWNTLEVVGPEGVQVGGGWFVPRHSLAGKIGNGEFVQFRFSALDFGAASIVEAGLDAVELFDLTCVAAEAPLAAPWPGGERKNRYVSFVPNNAGAVNFQVELVSGPGTPGVVGWVGTPDVNGLAQLVSAPLSPPRGWPEAEVHVGGCTIVPGASYGIRATGDGVVFSPMLHVYTAGIPIDGRQWADVVGLFNSVAGAWNGPEGRVTGFDATAVMQGFQGSLLAPPVSWADLHPQTPDRAVNGADILQVINAFQFAPYPFAAPDDCP